MDFQADILAHLRAHMKGMREQPYPWTEIAAFCSASTYRLLCEAFPKNDYRLCKSERCDKSYRMYARDVADETELLPTMWQEFVKCVASEAYAALLTQLTERSLVKMRRTLHFWRYARGCFLSPHVDKPEKIVTQIFYFNPVWPASWGGILRILNSCNERDIYREVVPSGNRSVVLVRTENSWHAVSGQTAPLPMERCALQLIYHR